MSLRISECHEIGITLITNSLLSPCPRLCFLQKSFVTRLLPQNGVSNFGSTGSSPVPALGTVIQSLCSTIFTDAIGLFNPGPKRVH